MRLNVQLTPREDEIAELLAWGASKKDVADKLFISARTVENTARNIYAKIGIQKATELCVWWFCKKCGVPTSLDPLKRAFVAVLLLISFAPREIFSYHDDNNMLRATRTRVTRTIRTSRRRGEEENEFSNLFNTAI